MEPLIASLFFKTESIASLETNSLDPLIGIPISCLSKWMFAPAASKILMVASEISGPSSFVKFLKN
jgi:hypothetical protein